MDPNCNDQNINNVIFNCRSSRCGAVLAAVIADILAEGLNSNQIAALGSFITIIGDSLGYISAQMELCESKNTNQEEKNNKSEE